MKNHWRKLLSYLPEKIERKCYEHYFKKEHSQLNNNASGVVTNLMKQQVLKEMKKRYDLNTLIETGTYLGDTLYSQYTEFEKLFSIELSHYFFKKAKRRFRKYTKINLIEGDSGIELPKLIARLNEPALFWLDGHFSGGLTAKGNKDCPIYEELSAIFNSPLTHVILIDDARAFTGANDYPTLNELEEFVKQKNPLYTFSLQNDCIRLLPS